MKRSLGLSLLLGLAALLMLVQPAKADGIIIPTPCLPERCPPLPCESGLCPPVISQLNIRYHHVTVSIRDQIAVTHVDQVFFNPQSYAVEGTYIFPLPADAVVSQFTLWVDGKPVEGKVLDAQQARQTYEEIVRTQRDPALLEYIGRGAVQASIFPIPPQGERRIELEYTQALTLNNGLVRYSYPLNTEKFSLTPLESVTISVQIEDQSPIRAVYSSSHPVNVDRTSDTRVSASYEAQQVTPDQDFTLYYSLGQTQALHLFTYRDPGDEKDPNGFFMLLLAPPAQMGQTPTAKDILLVLDRSGSMEGEKFSQAQAAARYILKHLNPKDRFFLLSFSSGMQVYADRLRPAEEADQAIAWIDQQSAVGSTDINRALLETAAVADRERPTYLLFMTDGLPTAGVTDNDAIIQNFKSAAPSNLRLFPFGVGYDVDTYLLDSLSEAHHGMSSYVQPGENLEEALSGFYERISLPVMTNIEVKVDGVTVNDLYPNPLPDLFANSQVIVVGRYQGSGAAAIHVSGEVNGSRQTLNYTDLAFSKDSRMDASAPSDLPRLWATRKIGYLLSKVRLQGADKETVDQIVKLSIRYGIITPYTSFLVTEPMPLGAENQNRVADETFNNYQAQPTQAVGQGAVQKAAEEGALSQAEAPVNAAESSGAAGGQVRTVGSRTFIFTQGKWVDTAYDPDRMPVVTVPFLSDAYMRLMQLRPETAQALSLGERVILVVDGQAYEVTSEGESSKTGSLPVELTPEQSATPGRTDLVATTTPQSPMPEIPYTPQPKPAAPTRFPLCAGLALPAAAWLVLVLLLRRHLKG